MGEVKLSAEEDTNVQGGIEVKVYSLRWYKVVSRKTTNNVVQYLLLRLHVSALALDIIRSLLFL